MPVCVYSEFQTHVKQFDARPILVILMVRYCENPEAVG